MPFGGDAEATPLPEEQQSQAPAAPAPVAAEKLLDEKGDGAQFLECVPCGKRLRLPDPDNGRYFKEAHVHCFTAETRGPPAASEEDKARAQGIVDRHFDCGLIDLREVADTIAAEFARIRAEATEAERQACAKLVNAYAAEIDRMRRAAAPEETHEKD